MFPGWLAFAVCLVFAAAFVMLARYGDRGAAFDRPAVRKAVYALTTCVYCSAWTFCGSVGVASRRGLDFLPFYIGPVITFAFCYPLIIRIIRLAKGQNITSIADFVAVRYGKAQSVAATVTVIAAVAYLPFIAVQLRAIAQALAVFSAGTLPPSGAAMGISPQTAGTALLLAVLTIALGARRLDATEHHHGLMLCVAAGSLLKLAAFIVVGVFVTWGLFHGIGDLTERVTSSPRVAEIINQAPNQPLWVAMIVVTMASVVVLPQQFHVGIVENRAEGDARTAAWAVPLYFVAITLFVMPIAAAGLLIFPDGTIDRSFTFLALPIHAKARLVTLIGLLGTLAAASCAFLVATTALAVMISNDLVIPILLRLRTVQPMLKLSAARVLLVRRLAILIIAAAAWLIAARASNAILLSIGFLSIVCVIQIAPAALGGLFWNHGTARGALGGSIAGVMVWAYTFLVPTLSTRSSAVVIDGPLGFDALRPTDLFGLNLAPFPQGVAWSLAINTLVFVGLSLSRAANANERLQANIFVRKKTMSLATSFRLRPFNVSVNELFSIVARYLGDDVATRVFKDYHDARGLVFDLHGEADSQLLTHTEHIIASATGAATARTIVSSLLEGRDISQGAALRIVDDVAFEIQNSRDVLQHAIDVAREGMAVYDSDLRLVAWNRAYRELFQIPPELLRVGVALDVLVRSNAERGVYGEGPIDEFVAARLETLTQPTEGLRLHSERLGRVLEMRSLRLHNGGMFFTYSDATAQVVSEAELEAENITLEKRVRERTEALETLNGELVRAKAEAEEANVSKTRFLAAASHDLLQPLNAARLYTTSLRERMREDEPDSETTRLAANVDASLEAVEDILGALLEISHLDAGATKTDITSVALDELFRQLRIEFEPIARDKGLRLKFVTSTLQVNSDRKLLRRLLQNLVSNAVKYTTTGRVVVGARRLGTSVRIDVCDTGIGIPQSQQHLVFREFERLPPAARAAPGVGLGLSIVERLSRVLKHRIVLRSSLDKGSVFSVILPRSNAAAAATSSPIEGPQRHGTLDGLVIAAVDNETSILTGLEALLQGWDCHVVTGTGLASIDAALDVAGLVPDVIVADYHIDDIDGLGVIDALRTRYGPCPAVLVTADRSSSLRELATAADVRVLNKPLRPAALRSLLSQWRLVKAAAE